MHGNMCKPLLALLVALVAITKVETVYARGLRFFYYGNFGKFGNFRSGVTLVPPFLECCYLALLESLIIVCQVENVIAATCHPPSAAASEFFLSKRGI